MGDWRCRSITLRPPALSWMRQRGRRLRRRDVPWRWRKPAATRWRRQAADLPARTCELRRDRQACGDSAKIHKTAGAGVRSGMEWATRQRPLTRGTFLQQPNVEISNLVTIFVTIRRR